MKIPPLSISLTLRKCVWEEHQGVAEQVLHSELTCKYHQPSAEARERDGFLSADTACLNLEEQRWDEIRPSDLWESTGRDNRAISFTYALSFKEREE